MSGGRRRVAFVVQRCGVEVNGGAEQLCLRIAQRMTAYWDVEILTTCALDYVTWADHYPAGPEWVDGVTIRRFPVEAPRDIAQFNRLSERLHPRRSSAPLAEQEAWMRAQGPWSPELFAFLDQQRDAYEAFLFFGYLYATTYFGLPQVRDKAWLAPLAHDEWPIYLSMWDRLFGLPRGFLFNTPEEREFVQRRFAQLKPEGPVAGVGVDPPADSNGARFRQRYGINDPFLLYMGRIEPAKGCDELFTHFIEWRRRERQPRKLVLLGRAVMEIPTHPDIVALGFVDEQIKWDALAACELLVMPSPYESLSIVLLEAWTVGKPVLVNGRCPVLVGQCRRANGGLWYEHFGEFALGLRVLEQDGLGARLGEQGRRFVERQYRWSRIEQCYLTLTDRA
jgi:glycosyltransferase involved in cell wall biosynthesis